MRPALIRMAFISAGLALAAILLGSTIAPSLFVTASTQDDVTSRISKNQQNMAKADKLFEERLEELQKLDNYEKQKHDSNSNQEKQDLDRKISATKESLDQLDAQIRDLEKLNIALFTLEPKLEEKLYSVELDLILKYLNDTSDTYIGENPVELIDADLLTRGIVITVDPEKISPDGSNLPSETEVKGIPISIEYAQTETVGCTPYTNLGECRPVIGGVSASEQNKAPDLNTLGYKATLNGANGFVLAGHTAVGPLKYIVQPHSNPAKVVGQVQAFCLNGTTCDFAWARMITGISVNDDLFVTPSNNLWDVNSKIADVNQTPGTLVAKSGAGSQFTTGQIYSNSPSVKYNRATFFITGGDSGSPVFYSSGTNTAKLFGMVFAKSGSQALYFPQDYIQTTINAIASTS